MGLIARDSRKSLSIKGFLVAEAVLQPKSPPSAEGRNEYKFNISFIAT
jgi:hypothetical protein